MDIPVIVLLLIAVVGGTVFLTHLWKKANEVLHWTDAHHLWLDGRAEAAGQGSAIGTLEAPDGTVASLVYAGDDDPNTKPNPIRERRDLLRTMGGTHLAQGDIGSFLLRRLEVPGEQSLAFCSNILVSSALLLTVVGLGFTLWGLGSSLGNVAKHGAVATASAAERSNGRADGAPSGASPDVIASVMAEVQKPLSSFPWLFAPTGFGLFLALIAQGRQRVIDRKLDETWERLDHFTETELLPAHIQTHSGERDESIAQLRDTVQDFADAAGSMKGTFDSVDSALKELGHLDQSEWAKELKGAAETFRSRIEASGGVLLQASEKLQASLDSFPSVAAKLVQSADSVTRASASLEVGAHEVRDQLGIAAYGMHDASTATRAAAVDLREALKELAKAQLEVVKLSDQVGALNNSISGLSHVFGQWSTDQQTQMGKLTETVKSLEASASDTLKSWKQVSDHISQNSGMLQKALDSTVQQFGLCNQDLRSILQKQESTFNQISAEVSRSMERGAARFMDQVGSLFDVDEQLHSRLETLSGRLEESRASNQLLTGSMQELCASVDRSSTANERAVLRSDELLKSVEASQRGSEQTYSQLRELSHHWAEQLELLRKDRQALQTELSKFSGSVEKAVRPAAGPQVKPVSPWPAGISAVSTSVIAVVVVFYVCMQLLTGATSAAPLGGNRPASPPSGLSGTSPRETGVQPGAGTPGNAPVPPPGGGGSP